jgi:hypothetical protein
MTRLSELSTYYMLLAFNESEGGGVGDEEDPYTWRAVTRSMASSKGHEIYHDSSTRVRILLHGSSSAQR